MKEFSWSRVVWLAQTDAKRIVASSACASNTWRGVDVPVSKQHSLIKIKGMGTGVWQVDVGLRHQMTSSLSSVEASLLPGRSGIGGQLNSQVLWPVCCCQWPSCNDLATTWQTYCGGGGQCQRLLISKRLSTFTLSTSQSNQGTPRKFGLTLINCKVKIRPHVCYKLNVFP